MPLCVTGGAEFSNEDYDPDSFSNLAERISVMVATRTRELAVRSALGASRRRVLGMVLFDVVKLVMPGVVVGLILTGAFIRINGDNMGIPLSNVEPLADLVGAAIAVLVAVLASLAPARRAASVQPMVAMRSL